MAKKIKKSGSKASPGISKKASANSQQQLLILGGIIAVSVILIAAVIFINQRSAGETKTIDENEAYLGIPIGGQHANAREVDRMSDVGETVERGITEDGIPYVGDPDAAITIAEFADFSCIHCAEWSETGTQIVKDFARSGDVLFMYYPLAAESRAPYSRDAARAALCAAEQGGFWEMHDEIFRVHLAQSYGEFTPSGMENIAESIGLDGSQVRACMNTNRADGALVTTTRLAQELGAVATPTIVYKLAGDAGWRTIPSGNSISGGRGYDTLANLIRQANAETGG